MDFVICMALYAKELRALRNECRDTCDIKEQHVHLPHLCPPDNCDCVPF